MKNCDLSNYSAVILVGGDGTFHEAINGMLMRTDNIKLPIGFFPAGTGNDTCKSLGINSQEEALENILKK
jgi:diacylglycerol kinase family enzyme